MNKQVRSLLSLCQKAGKVTTGEESCERAIANGYAKLIIIANDASDNTKKKFKNKGLYYNVPVLIFSDREALSSSIGKSNRPTLVITDESFGQKLFTICKVDSSI